MIRVIKSVIHKPSDEGSLSDFLTGYKKKKRGVYLHYTYTSIPIAFFLCSFSLPLCSPRKTSLYFLKGLVVNSVLCIVQKARERERKENKKWENLMRWSLN